MHTLLIVLCWVIGYLAITFLFVHLITKKYISEYKKNKPYNKTIERYLDDNIFEIGMMSFFWPISAVPIICSLIYEQIIQLTLDHSDSSDIFPDKHV